MPAIAAIDVGSNAMRLAIARVGSAGRYEIIYSARESVRLGHDVFTTGRITPATMTAALEAFRRFRIQLSRYAVGPFKAVATSAVREAENGMAFTALVEKRHRIGISVITPEEEARLVHLAVKERVNLDGKPVLLVDIGGGSVEITLGNKNGIISTRSYAAGSVRLLRLLERRRPNDSGLDQLVDRCVDVTRRRLRKDLGGEKVNLCIATGGSMESLGEIRRVLWKTNDSSRISFMELASMARKIRALSVAERVERFRLRPDRADVISPAAVVLQKIVQQTGVQEILIPRVSVKDGLLSELVWEGSFQYGRLDREEIMNSALQLGRKYSFDEPHGRAVSRVATQIFDQMRAIHNLDGENRILLEVASLLHDTGHFVGHSHHHKHSFYLIQTGPIIGLSPIQIQLVANVARYHRKSTPCLEHEAFRGLNPRQRKIVVTLSAILRIADVVARHGVELVALSFRRREVTFRLHGNVDLLPVRQAVAKRCDLFEETFGRLVFEHSRVHHSMH
jgi:exopolyphosphatase/guanosine-5'-triphosphate,3'-diphosphate pyrophosphatase